MENMTKEQALVWLGYVLTQLDDSDEEAKQAVKIASEVLKESIKKGENT